MDIDYINIVVSNLEAAAGVSFRSDIQVFPDTGKKLVYFTRPDGIILEFAEYPRS